MTPHITLIKGALHKQGGLEKYTWQLAQDFCKKNVRVTLLTTSNPTPPFFDSLLDIVSLPIKHSFSYMTTLAFDKACHHYLSKNPTPIVFGLDRNRFQTHLRAGNGVHASYLKHRGQEEGFTKKLSFSINPLHQLTLCLEKQAFEHPALQILFTNSFMVKDEILEYYRTDPDKIQVIHNGVEWHKMQTPFDLWQESRQRWIDQWGLRKEAFQLLFVGHNFKRKGLEKLLYALSFLKQEDFELSVVGEDKNASYFVALCKRLNLSSKVRFFGKQPTALPFYQCADALVIPSLYDPFANVTVEALAMGLFVLSSSKNGGSEILNADNGAIIQDLSDTKEFAALLLNVFLKKKTAQRALVIRNSVKHLDFSHQLRAMTEMTLST